MSRRLLGGACAGLLWGALSGLAHGLWAAQGAELWLHAGAHPVLVRLAASGTAGAGIGVLAGLFVAVAGPLGMWQRSARSAAALLAVALWWLQREAWLPELIARWGRWGAESAVAAVSPLGALLAIMALRSLVAERGRAGMVHAGLAVAAGLAAVHVAAAWSAADADEPSVLLVVVDCLRPDHLGLHGHAAGTSPTLDELADRSLVFDRGYSTASWTKTAVASVLTGRFGHEHRVLRLADGVPDGEVLLPERMAAAGYDTLFVGGGNGWISQEFGFHRGYRHFEQDAGDAGGIVDHALAQLPAAGTPFFAYLHFMDVHMPYGRNAMSDRVQGGPDDHPQMQVGALDSRWVRRRHAAGLLRQRDRQRIAALYDAQVRHVDGQLRRLFEALHARGQWDNTLLVVTADHGEELWDRTTFGHGHSLREVPIRVPLMLHGPGVKPGRRSEPVSLVDVVPTVLGVAGGGERGLAAAGSDLLAGPVDGQRALYFTSAMYGREKVGVLRGRTKLIATGRRHGGSPNLIGADDHGAFLASEIGTDGVERMGGNNRELSSLLEEATRGVLDMDGVPAGGAGQQGSDNEGDGDADAEIDEGVKRQLRALGYVE